MNKFQTTLLALLAIWILQKPIAILIFTCVVSPIHRLTLFTLTFEQLLVAGVETGNTLLVLPLFLSCLYHQIIMKLTFILAAMCQAILA